MTDVPAGGDRLAKVIARVGLCSRRDAEGWIKDGRVRVNGTEVRTPAFNVSPRDRIEVDGAPLAAREPTKLWLYHKPAGLVVTESDPEGRPTIFTSLEEKGLPRILTVGRLDINTEGLLLLTNDGGLKRVLELPSTGWLRRYRVRAHGTVSQSDLDRLGQGIEIEGVKYGAIEATFERQQGSNVWLLVALREGKNREVKTVLGALGLAVNRLIRVSYGPFQLGDLAVGAVEPVRTRILKDQLGTRLAREARVDFTESPTEPARPLTPRAPQARGRGTHERGSGPQTGRGARDERAARPVRPRKIHYDDGRQSTEFEEKTYGKKPRSDGERPGSGAPGAERPARTGPSGGRRDDAPRQDARPRRFEGAKRPDSEGAKPFRKRPDRPAGDRPPRSADGPRPARKGPPRWPGRDDAAGGSARPAFPPRGKAGGAARPTGGRPTGGRPAGSRPTTGRPTGGRPPGGKPTGPRRPRPPKT